MALIFVLSSIPGEKLPDLKWDFISSAGHFAEYVIFGILCARAIGVSYPEARPKNIFIFGFLFSLIFAFSDEMHQRFVPGRFWAVSDLIADSLGALFGILIYTCKKRLSWQR